MGEKVCSNIAKDVGKIKEMVKTLAGDMKTWWDGVDWWVAAEEEFCRILHVKPRTMSLLNVGIATNVHVKSNPRVQVVFKA